jgi:hypothetical protein
MASVKAILLITWMTSAGVTADHVEYGSMAACQAAARALQDTARQGGATDRLVTVCTPADAKEDAGGGG